MSENLVNIRNVHSQEVVSSIGRNTRQEKGNGVLSGRNVVGDTEGLVEDHWIVQLEREESWVEGVAGPVGGDNCAASPVGRGNSEGEGRDIRDEGGENTKLSKHCGIGTFARV